MTDLLEGLSLARRRQIAGEALRLLQALQPDKPVREAIRARQVWLPEQGPGAGRDIVRIGSHPLGAMLISRPAMQRPRVAELDALRGWALVATLRFCATHKQSDHFGRVTEGLRVVRRLVGNRYKSDLLAEMPAFGSDLQQLRAALRILEGQLEARDSDLIIQARSLSRLIADADTVRDPVFRGPAEQARAGAGLPDLIVEETPDGIQVYELSDTARETEPEELTEDRRLLYYRFPELASPTGRITALAAHQLRLFEAEETERGWTGDFASLSAVEARTIWRKAWEQKDRHTGAAWALALMTFGRDLSGIGTSPHIGESWWEGGGISFAPDVTDQTLRTAEKNRFTMRPPPELRPLFQELAVRTDAETDCRNWLRTMAADRPISPGHLIRALRDGMPRVDRAVVALLTGRKVARAVQLYYTQVQVGMLSAIWNDALQSRFGTKLPFIVSSPGTVTGTLKAPSRNMVRRYFQGLVRNARRREYDSSLVLNSEVQHFAGQINLYGAVLNFLTARRPHGAAFEPFGQIVGRERPRLFLTGKGGRLVDDGRWVPLCPTAQRIVALWQGRCHAMAQTTAARFPELRDRLTRSVDGTSPPFFNWGSAFEAPSSLTAAMLWERAGVPAKRGPAAANNWARHYVRSALLDHDMPGHIIDGFMGHGGHISDPLAPSSAHMIAEHDQLREALEQIWQGLDVDLPEVET